MYEINDRKLCFDEKEGGKVMEDYMNRIMILENHWDRNVEGDAVKGPVSCICRDDVMQILMK